MCYGQCVEVAQLENRSGGFQYLQRQQASAHTLFFHSCNNRLAVLIAEPVPNIKSSGRLKSRTHGMNANKAHTTYCSGNLQWEVLHKYWPRF